MTQEDERIRQFLIQEVTETSDEIMSYRNMNKKSVLAWLEKQGEQKPAIIIPKFIVGDEIKTANEEVLTITKIDEKGYWSDDLFICSFDDANKWKLVKQKPADIDNLAKLWTIQDAKDGDILVSKSGDKIFSYRGNLDLKGRPCAHYGIYKVHDEIRFTPCAIGNYFTYEEVYPATKEQRDLLFSKMKESGYEWDDEKKVLKKIK